MMILMIFKPTINRNSYKSSYTVYFLTQLEPQKSMMMIFIQKPTINRNSYKSTQMKNRCVKTQHPPLQLLPDAQPSCADQQPSCAAQMHNRRVPPGIAIPLPTFLFPPAHKSVKSPVKHASRPHRRKNYSRQSEQGLRRVPAQSIIFWPINRNTSTTLHMSATDKPTSIRARAAPWRSRPHNRSSSGRLTETQAPHSP